MQDVFVTNTDKAPVPVVGVGGQMTVSNLPVVQEVAGSVSVTNFPSEQPVSGTVTVSNLESRSAAHDGGLLRYRTSDSLTVPAGTVVTDVVASRWTEAGSPRCSAVGHPWAWCAPCTIA